MRVAPAIQLSTEVRAELQNLVRRRRWHQIFANSIEQGTIFTMPFRWCSTFGGDATRWKVIIAGRPLARTRFLVLTAVS